MKFNSFNSLLVLNLYIPTKEHTRTTEKKGVSCLRPNRKQRVFSYYIHNLTTTIHNLVTWYIK